MGYMFSKSDFQLMWYLKSKKDVIQWQQDSLQSETLTGEIK